MSKRERESIVNLHDDSQQLKKNIFDLSNKSVYTNSIGLLLPVATYEVNPKEKVRLKTSTYLRTQPLNTAAFARMRCFTHVFFVSNASLWSGFEQFSTNTNFSLTRTIRPSQKDLGKLPHFSIGTIMQRLRELDKFLNLSVEQFKKFEQRDGFDQLDNPINEEIEHFDEDGYISAFRKQMAGLLLMPINGTDIHGYSQLENSMRLLEMLEYGVSSNAYQALRRIRSLIGKFLNDWKDKGDSFLTSNSIGSLQGSVEGELDVITESFNREVNPFRLLAYQKIYQEYYKNDDYEATNPDYFNIDGTTSAHNPALTDPLDVVKNMVSLRYRWYSRDYFTSVVPSELYGVEMLQNPVGEQDTSRVEGVAGKNVNSVDVIKGLTTKQIRTAFAIEKFMRLTRNAKGFDYANQISAHYGVHVDDSRSGAVRFLGGSSQEIQISEVLSTAETEQGAVGQIFGKGESNPNSDVIEFTVPEHGIIMVIQSIVPDIDYSMYGLSPFNQKITREQYFQPEFADLGYQALFSSQLNAGTDVLLGYQPRYSEYKMAFDKVFGEFRRNGSLSAWSVTSSLGLTQEGLNVNSLRINPAIGDSIFAVNYNGSPETDQFMCQSYFDCKIIRPMSVSSQGNY